jgi:hypothetical protein
VREQPDLKVSVNCLAAIVEFLARLLREPSSSSDGSSGSGFATELRKESIEAALIVLNCLTEMVEGPCPMNQSFLAMRTEALELINTVMRLNETRPIPDANGILHHVPSIISKLKLRAVDLLLGILEKRSAFSPDGAGGARDEMDTQVLITATLYVH